MQATGTLVTGDLRIDALLGGSQWVGASVQTVELTYSFPDSASLWSTTVGEYAAGVDWGPLSGVAALSDVAKNAVRAALASWSTVANIRFVETADNASTHGTLRFAWTVSAVDEQSFAYAPDSTDKAGDIWLNSLAPWDGFTPGSYGYSTLIHEIGHALGLKHPFEGALTLPAQQESYAYSLMSYTAFAGSARSWVDFEPTTPMLYDLLAIQSMYGGNLTTRSGDDTYVFTENQHYFQTLWDAAGNDTIVWQGQTLGARIDLNAGKYSQLGEALTYWSEDFSSSWTDRDTVAIAFGVAIENATGGDSDDTLIGNALDNRLVGGAGNDTLYGGAGLDTAVYKTDRVAHNLSTVKGGFSISGPEGTDAITGVERLQFSDKKIAMDLAPSEHAGQALEFIGVLAPSLVHAPSIVGVILGLIDGGTAVGSGLATALNRLRESEAKSKVVILLTDGVSNAGTVQPTDAAQIAEQLGIPFRVVNLMTEYREKVVKYLLEGYQSGITPNPDVMCNREIKFKTFLEHAQDLGLDAVSREGASDVRGRNPAGAHRTPFGVEDSADPSRRRQWRAAAHTRTVRSRAALAITETELSDMAAAASIGLSSSPKTG